MTNVQRLFNGERTVSSTCGAGATEYSHVKAWRWTLYITAYAKIKSKWTKTYIWRTKNIKLLRKQGIHPHDLRFGNVSLCMTSKAWATTENTDKLDFAKIKHVCIKRHHFKSEKAACGMKEIIFKSYIWEEPIIQNI